MRALLIEPFGGVAGDMFVASLLGLGVDFEKFKKALATLPVSEEWSVELSNVERHAVSARHFSVNVAAETGEAEHHHHDSGHSHGPSRGSEDSNHHHHHHHHHHHDEGGSDKPHQHRKLDDVLKIIDGASGIPDSVKRRASAVFAKLAEAEAEVHGKDDPRGVHFHEVGAVDAIIDITGACLALEMLGVDRMFSTPVPLGTGSVESAHGVLPVPVPATVNILRGLPVERTNIPFELATPTGAAILAVLVDEWVSGDSADLAGFEMAESSYGAGTRDIPQRAGVLRATLLERARTPAPETDKVAVLECEIDDMPGEIMTWLSEKLMPAGALDYSTTAVMMKKNRPGISLRVISTPERAAEIADLILRGTTTLGVRRQTVERFKLRRETRDVETPLGTVSAKFAFDGDGALVKAKPEYESVAELAERNGVTFLKAAEIAKRALAKDHIGTDMTD